MSSCFCSPCRHAVRPDDRPDVMILECCNFAAKLRCGICKLQNHYIKNCYANKIAPPDKTDNKI
ncbi:CLUMA_CG008141, isoform A [Clunio marinus]|uniref:CLUMA_CG008141, isoform A n=1 Tax=Clunio marinus TaxID=568069 RepID=A0A1J1I8A2_9DIPT|nr:CLUMA_CG008141, isoform A [Clunio marinus]